MPTRFRGINFGISASRKSFATFMSHSFKLCNFRSAQFLQGFYVPHKKRYLLHFSAFFRVASLLSIGVDNEKALELDNGIFFSYFSLIPMKKYHPKMQKTSFCTVA